MSALWECPLKASDSLSKKTVPELMQSLTPFSFAFSFSLMPWKLKATPLGSMRLPRAPSVYKEKQMKTAAPLTEAGVGLLFFCAAQSVPRSPSVTI